MTQGDHITVDGILCEAAIGITPQERSLPQTLEISFTVTVPSFAYDSPDTATAIAFDYSEFVPRVKKIVESKPYHLIETVGNVVAAELCSCPAVESVTVAVLKRPQGLPSNRGVTYRCRRVRSDFGV